MKAKLLLLFIALLLAMCSFACNNEKYKSKPDEVENSQYSIVVIDSCEYIKYYYYGTFVHKGNCKNHKK